MKKSIAAVLGIFMAASVFFAGCNGKKSAESASSSSSSKSAKSTEKGTAGNPFTLGVSPMSGWYGWYGVEGKGFFEKEGVSVQIKFFPVYSDSLTAFYSGQLDGICIAGSDCVAPLNEGVDFKVVLVNDNSYGADGLVVNEGINSIQDLKGHSVSTEIGTLEHMFLLKILEDNGMTINDVNFSNMTINDAGPAFIAKSVDAAVLWEPTLSTAIAAGGKLLYSTKQTPGLIPDTLAVTSKIAKENPETVQKVVNAWFDVVPLLNARDEETIQLVCKGAELTKDDYITMLDGVTLFDKEMNQKTFQPADDYTSLAFTIQKSAEFLKDTKMVDKVPADISVILDDEFIK